MILPLCVKKGSQQGEVSWLMIMKGKASVGRLSIFGTWNQWVNVGYIFLLEQQISKIKELLLV
jgi:hypothetical protein